MLRAAGRDGGTYQTLLPPSVADRERREWHGEIIAPAVVSSTILRTACTWLAIGCLVRRHVGEYPSEHLGPSLDSPALADALREHGVRCSSRTPLEWARRYPGLSVKIGPARVFPQRIVPFLL